MEGFIRGKPEANIRTLRQGCGLGKPCRRENRLLCL